jgi:hypothetical protein
LHPVRSAYQKILQISIPPNVLLDSEKSWYPRFDSESRHYVFFLLSPVFRKRRIRARPTPDRVDFNDVRRVRPYADLEDWRYVLVRAGPEQAASWRDLDHCKGGLLDLMSTANRSWLVSAFWDDDWTCIGGSRELVDAFWNHPNLQDRLREVKSLIEYATPPGHTASTPVCPLSANRHPGPTTERSRTAVDALHDGDFRRLRGPEGLWRLRVDEGGGRVASGHHRPWLPFAMRQQRRVLSELATRRRREADEQHELTSARLIGKVQSAT